MQKDMKETEVLRLAIASQKNDKELARKILNNFPNKAVLLRGAIGVILTMVYEAADDENSPESILDQMLMDYTLTNMDLENG